MERGPGCWLHLPEPHLGQGRAFWLRPFRHDNLILSLFCKHWKRQAGVSAQRDPVGYLSLGLRALALCPSTPRLEGKGLCRSYLGIVDAVHVCPHAYTHTELLRERESKPLCTFSRVPRPQPMWSCRMRSEDQSSGALVACPGFRIQEASQPVLPFFSGRASVLCERELGRPEVLGEELGKDPANH